MFDLSYEFVTAQTNLRNGELWRANGSGQAFASIFLIFRAKATRVISHRRATRGMVRWKELMSVTVQPEKDERPAQCLARSAVEAFASDPTLEAITIDR